jgi:hypothetical protein
MLRASIALLSLSVLGLLVLAITGSISGGVAVVLTPLLAVALVIAVIFDRLASSHRDAAAAVQELLKQGRRVQAKVLDVVPYNSGHAGSSSALIGNGQQLVLRVQLADAPSGHEVDVHLVERSEPARARIGTTVTVLVHPTDPHLRTLEGYLPNGIPVQHAALAS